MVNVAPPHRLMQWGVVNVSNPTPLVPIVGVWSQGLTSPHAVGVWSLHTAPFVGGGAVIAYSPIYRWGCGHCIQPHLSVGVWSLHTAPFIGGGVVTVCVAKAAH